MSREYLRKVYLTPYAPGQGPTFTLTMWDTGKVDYRGVMRIRYTLTETRTLFEGEDFSPSPLHTPSSDESVKALLSFLCLRPGDTDKGYFANYTEDQKTFCNHHAEALQCECLARFGE